MSDSVKYCEGKVLEFSGFVIGLVAGFVACDVYWC